MVMGSNNMDSDPSSNVLVSLRDSLREFAEERDWNQFHTPRNLATALIVEAAELLEHFQWQAQGRTERPSPEALTAIAEEMADVLIYLVRLADKLDIDLHDAARRKMEINARRYPLTKARGNSRKYSDLQ
jgi:NTP pyrophosphatase (non-canonical NTP hydrolase)